MEHGLGRLYVPDVRDQQYLMRNVLDPQEVKYARSWRYYKTGPVLDQGRSPHCVGYAWRQWMSSAHIMTREGPGSPIIYHEAQQRDAWPGVNYDGTSVRAGAKYLQELGHISTYLWAWSADEVADWILANRGTVVLGTVWFSGMSEPDPKTGICLPVGSVLGGHAYLCVGYNADRGLFRCLNSWGFNWGQRGRFWLQHQDLDWLLKERGEACTAVEAKL